jgi:hypothetical protein
MSDILKLPDSGHGIAHPSHFKIFEGEREEMLEEFCAQRNINPIRRMSEEISSEDTQESFK